MPKLLLFIASYFLLISSIYSQNDTIPSSADEEDSVVYIREDPLIIKKTVEIAGLMPEKKYQVLLLAHAGFSLFNDAYSTNSTGTDTYTNTVQASLSGSYSFRWGAELIFLLHKKYSIGLEYDFGTMNQAFNYTLPNGLVKSCNTFMDHSYLLLKLGRSFRLTEKISLHPRLGIGTAILYQQEGLIPSLANSYYDDYYQDYIKINRFTPMADLEVSLLYRFKKYLLVGLSPYINGNILTYTSDAPYNLYRQNYGVRILLGIKII